MLEADIKKEVPEMNLAEKKAKEFEEIKKKEKEDIESIKDTYKSNTTKRVTDLIENLRKRREEIKAKTYAPTSPVRDEGKGMNTFAPSGVPARKYFFSYIAVLPLVSHLLLKKLRAQVLWV